MTAIEYIKSFLSLFKLTPRHLATFAITSLIIFFFPAKFTKDIFPTTLYDYYRPISGFVFLLSTSGLFVELIIFLSRPIRHYLFIQKRKSRLESLTKEEKNILRRYMTDEKRTQHFAVYNGTVAELEALGILISYVQQYNIIQGVPYGIADWALKYLKSNSHLLND
jgi:hypothetical protein